MAPDWPVCLACEGYGNAQGGEHVVRRCPVCVGHGTVAAHLAAAFRLGGYSAVVDAQEAEHG